MTKHQDADPVETREWLDAIDTVIANEGVDRARFLLERLIGRMRQAGADLPFSATTPYVNTIPVSAQAQRPSDFRVEARLSSITRWNAMALVVAANKESTELGGHVASYASAATLYDIGFNHFWHAPGEKHGGDLLYLQGHSSPGFYARAFLEGRIDETRMRNFRQEVDGRGLSSYPHPWLMPDFWQFPTVSMGLGPIMAIYQAKFLRYLQDRGLAKTEGRKVWCFIGDGETDEPESLGSIAMAGREKLDNLIFVVNCNLQRLDGPVRGNGKIIQELESSFRGAGWSVIKVIWGSNWDPLLARDTTGRLRQLMEECVDGDYQAFKSRDGAFVRKEFFGRYPETAAMVADWTDEQIWSLSRGGHDPIKVYAAYKAASEQKGQPTVILAKTIKGFGMGEAMEGQNIAHQAKKMKADQIRAFRDRFHLPIADDQLEQVPFYRPPEDSPEMKWLKQRLQELGGGLPRRRRKAEPLQAPPLSAFEAQLKSSGERELSTTMAFVRILTTLLRDKNIGPRVVPIVADEARTFGMEGMFRQYGIYSHVGQLYRPEDADQLMFYKEAQNGQILEEGINEAGAISSWIAAGTSYSTNGVQMVPVYLFYSMFGFQRVGDLAWAAGDMRTRGFLIGATSGRTTLNGEGLQHQDGHSHVVASSIPNCIAYDPAFQYELAVIVQDGLRRMVQEQEDVYYYLTVMNENYAHPDMPQGAEAGILKGMYRFRERPKSQVQLLGSGTILREVIAAAELLEKDFGVAANLWSVTSFSELRRDGLDVDRWNAMHPQEKPRVSYVEQCLKGRSGPIIAATDYIKLHADSIRAFLPARYRVLGTDGFGRSDTRAKLRHFFEVNRHWIAAHALRALAEDGAVPAERVAEALKKYGLDPEKPNPVTV
ncbi:MAG: pyruvate dehydrogenase (acetyl-transferring), homodimeric type [Deltaproteobacteria bacterium 13_1_40CM_68_24]|nr:MAG: pyruvate dehydrogenase (acetyl-transferring), homodimeric type [Deltaproteobacteria bacterium 13_1_40CM_68_24]OLC77443.1 MAG: pyruvate dehydrogenase (acetyl-transferring), homodimeric type [Deltaproteobacteria bacterium 13_1_40CM_4_68_19]